jgi:uncharacterized protein YeaO (DUF488 family)
MDPRILVERLWPRGLSPRKARLDQWAKDLAPSHGLRRWFGHDPARWTSFRRRYRKELSRSQAPLADLRHLLKTTAITVVFAAKDEERDSAVVLREHLLGQDGS